MSLDVQPTGPPGRGRQGAFVRAAGPFGLPTGIRGWLAGQIMARGNQPMNVATARLLDVQPDDRVLEIGFGPGRLIELLADRANRGLVAGVDPSAVMLQQACTRNQLAIDHGRVDLRQAGVSSLPFPDQSFTRACAVNSFYFWPSPEADLREVRRVLRESGRLVLGLRRKDPMRRFLGHFGFTSAEVDETLELVRRAGFRDVRAHEEHDPRATYVVARS